MVNGLRHVRSVQVHVVMSIAWLHVYIVQVLKIEDHYVAHVKEDWHANYKQRYCHHTRSSIKVTPLKFIFYTSYWKQANLCRKEYLQEKQQVYPEKDPLKKIATWQDDAHPPAAHPLVVSETYSAASVEQNTEEKHNHYYTYRHELERNKVGREVAHLKVGATECLLGGEFFQQHLQQWQIDRYWVKSEHVDVSWVKTSWDRVYLEQRGVSYHLHGVSEWPDWLVRPTIKEHVLDIGYHLKNEDQVLEVNQKLQKLVIDFIFGWLEWRHLHLEFLF